MMSISPHAGQPALSILLPSVQAAGQVPRPAGSLARKDRKRTRLNSSHSQISYAVFCFKKKMKDGQSIIGRVYGDRIHILLHGCDQPQTQPPRNVTIIGADTLEQLLDRDILIPPRVILG